MRGYFTTILTLFVILLIPQYSHAFPTAQILATTDPSFVYPVVRPRLSSKFGSRRHPIFKVTRNHSGIDLAAPLGAPVRAIGRGKVVFADPYAGYGNLVVILHNSGMTSHYGHLDKIKISIGEEVAAGQIIATLGNSGQSTGPHLHFEIRRNGKPLDPLKLIPGLTSKAQG